MLPEDIDNLVQSGINYNTSINLYAEVAKNEKFFRGDSWDGATGGTPKPNTNIIKRICQQKISDVNGQKIAIQFSTPDFPSEVITEEMKQRQMIAIQTMASGQPFENGVNPLLASEGDCEILNAMFEMDCERVNMDMIDTEGLQDACVSGDYIIYNYFDPNADTGQANKGQIEWERIDNVNYIPRNPNERDPQKQIDMVILRREMVLDVKEEMKFYGCPKDDIDSIIKDQNTQYQAGDMARKELIDSGDGKIITHTYFKKDKETHHIIGYKCTKDFTIHKEWDTKTKRYPLAIYAWETVKNSWHGRSEVKDITANQKAHNVTRALGITSLILTGSPRIIHDNRYIKSIDTDITKPISVNANINDAVKYLNPSSMSADAYALPNAIKQDTFDVTGCSDISIGNANNASPNAMSMAISRSQIPLETKKKRFYAFEEEKAKNWLDMTLAYFTESRWVLFKDKSGTYKMIFDPKDFKNKVWSVRIDVGQSKQWQKNDLIAMIQQLAQTHAVPTSFMIEMMDNKDLNNNKENILKALKEWEQSQMKPQGQPPMGQPPMQ